MKTIAAVVLMLAMAVPAAAQPSPQATAYSNRLSALPTIQRRAVLRRAIMDGKGMCKVIEDGHFQQDYRNLKMWVARCDRTVDQALFVGPDGTVQVRPCADLPKLKLPACRYVKPKG